MGGLQAAQPPEQQQQTPNDLAAIWRAIQIENERRRALAMNERAGMMPDPTQGDPTSVSAVLKAIGGF